jgi:hypothetical protein
VLSIPLIEKDVMTITGKIEDYVWGRISIDQLAVLPGDYIIFDDSGMHAFTLGLKEIAAEEKISFREVFCNPLEQDMVMDILSMKDVRGIGYLSTKMKDIFLPLGKPIYNFFGMDIFLYDGKSIVMLVTPEEAKR